MRQQQSREPAEFLLEWERLIWMGRAGLCSGLRRVGERYFVTDFRAGVLDRSGALRNEVALQDLASVDFHETTFQRIRGRSTVTIRSRRAPESPVLFADIRQGPQLALVLQFLTVDTLRGELDDTFLKSAIGKGSPDPFAPNRGWVLALALLVVAASTTVRLSLPLSGSMRYRSAAYRSSPVTPGDRAAMLRFMEGDVMSFARRTLGPLKGGANRISCATCHGQDGEARDWKMPAVGALPEPELKMAGMELHNANLDAQIRNAVYGYLAEEDNQGKAAYMRGVVMPGMAALLGRPAYDFTRSYEYNSAQQAFGCYHCHEVR